MSLTDPVTWIPGTVIFLLTVIVEVILRARDKREKAPIVYSRTKCIVGSSDQQCDDGDIRILYKGKPVPRVSVTRVGFANKGKGLITKEEVSEPIKLDFGDEVQILRKPRVLRETRPGIAFAAIKDGNKVRFSFDHLAHMDGAVVEVVHTGDEHTTPQFHGEIRDVTSGIRQVDPKYAEARRRKWLLVIPIISGGTLVYILLVLVPAFKSDYSRNGTLNVWAIALGAAIVLGFSILFITSLVDWMRTLPSKLSLDD